ncbi:SDR family NAD(P)-dependent oxidoreductase [Nocardioides panacis]|uniref:SDR family NAD(P)-dependent oxidoreductase n=1 Tax=Nocardioides panacis TaxID=2849501 RepID=A0A975SYB1_9ACTN|nr:SDR family NAD(P)-dependent oxidoreductase [Nocardioides panacis]QWZ08086.1 SDR family NAD(P)-dependent oxidoreductase [Nocardioides panacis]
MKYLVTGAAGFIGSHLVDHLVRQGHDVLGVDRMTDYYDVAQKRSNLAAAMAYGNFEFLEADASAPEALARLDGTDVVYHLAGQPGVTSSWAHDFHRYLEHNVAATQALLEAARHASVGRIVYASSSSVYGNQAVYPCDESVRPQPYSPYGVTKLAAEHLCGLYAANYGTPTVSLRYFSVYGPRQRPDMAFSRFIRTGLAGGQLTVTGDGTQVRDFTFVEDVVAATVAAGTRGVAPGTVLNVAGGQTVTINAVLAIIERELGHPLKVAHVPDLAGDVARTGGAGWLAEDMLGWVPAVRIEEGLPRQVRWEVGRQSMVAA